MTLKNGRYGKRYYRANKDPRGEWAAGPGASGGFRPESGVRFSRTKANTKLGLKLSRQGAQPTRGANKMMRQSTVTPKPAYGHRRYSGSDSSNGEKKPKANPGAMRGRGGPEHRIPEPFGSKPGSSKLKTRKTSIGGQKAKLRKTKSGASKAKLRRYGAQALPVYQGHKTKKARTRKTSTGRAKARLRRT